MAKVKSTKITRFVKANCPVFDVDDDGRSVAEVKDFIQSLDVKSVDKAASAYLDACSVLATMEKTVKDVNVQMAAVWEGDASVVAQEALQILHATLRDVSNNLNSMGRSLESLASKLRDHQDFVGEMGPILGRWSDNSATWDDSTPGWYGTMRKGTEWGSQDELAGQHLRFLNDDLLEVYTSMPDFFQEVLPDIKSPRPPEPPKPPTDDHSPTDRTNYHLNPLSSQHPTPNDALTTTAADNLTNQALTPGTDPTKNQNPGDSTNTNTNTLPDLGGPDAPQTPDPNTSSSASAADGTDPSGTSTDPTAPSSQNLTQGFDDPTKNLNSSLPNPNTQTTLADYRNPALDSAHQNPLPSSYNNTPSSPTHTFATPGGVTGANTGAVVGGAYGSGVGAPAVTTAAGAKSGSTGSTIPYLPHGTGPAAHESEQEGVNSWLKEQDDVWVGQQSDSVSHTIDHHA